MSNCGMACRRAEEAELEKKLAQREETALMKEKQYATLDQEVKDTKKKLKKLLNKHEVNYPPVYLTHTSLDHDALRSCLTPAPAQQLWMHRSTAVC